MMTTLQHFFYMGGYAWYVWPSYASVLVLLGRQWFLSWRQWHRYVKQQQL